MLICRVYSNSRKQPFHAAKLVLRNYVTSL